MKHTLNIDSELLARVVTITNSKTKTEAIHYALLEVSRRARLLEVLSEGTGASSEELKSLFDDDTPDLMVAENPSSFRTSR
jgi:signal recognition particle GTPase